MSLGGDQQLGANQLGSRCPPNFYPTSTQEAWRLLPPHRATLNSSWTLFLWHLQLTPSQLCPRSHGRSPIFLEAFVLFPSPLFPIFHKTSKRPEQLPAPIPPCRPSSVLWPPQSWVVAREHLTTAASLGVFSWS